MRIYLKIYRHDVIIIFPCAFLIVSLHAHPTCLVSYPVIDSVFNV